MDDVVDGGDVHTARQHVARHEHAPLRVLEIHINEKINITRQRTLKRSRFLRRCRCCICACMGHAGTRSSARMGTKRLIEAIEFTKTIVLPWYFHRK